MELNIMHAVTMALRHKFNCMKTEFSRRYPSRLLLINPNITLAYNHDGAAVGNYLYLKLKSMFNAIVK